MGGTLDTLQTVLDEPGQEVPMRRRALAFLATAALAVPASFAASTSRRAPDQEIANVATFARLYGAARYFYPSDAAAVLDWNRLAVHGVRRVRSAADSRQLASTLRELFEPLGPGIAIAPTLPPAAPAEKPDSLLVAWRYHGAGISQSAKAGIYRAQRTRRVTGSIDGFVTMMQTVPAGQDLQGKTIRLRGQVRASSGDRMGSAALWLRVDRPDRQMGFFDNMGNRPIREPKWLEYVIEGSVADDATAVAFGVMASGVVTADFDVIDLSVRDASGTWKSVAIKDPGFELAADAPSGGWFRAGISTTAEVSRSDDGPAEGSQFMRLAPRSSPPSESLAADATSKTVTHVDIDLGSGLKARVPLALTDTQASAAANDAKHLAALRAELSAMTDPDGHSNLDVRLADVVVTWSVFRHFYPYWAETRVDWDARLRPQLELAYEADTRDAHRDALRHLVADARDGHGSVRETRTEAKREWLPVQFGMVGGQLVITASSVSTDAPIGAVVAKINGTPALERITGLEGLASGTTQWKQTRALREIASGPRGTVVQLVVDSGAGPRTTTLTYEASSPAAETRPDTLVELTPGVWYVDLTRARMSQITPVLPKLAGATGVVFDVRGYPTDAGSQILPHLLGEPENDRWMHIAEITGPFGQSDGWESLGWNMNPASPRVGGKIVFLTDGRAISYAESVMGYVADRRLGTIVGGTTAGTNGNVATFDVPGGFTVTFTGMRVTRHDGRTPFHLIGVKPDIAVAPTISGLRAGRDEVLERALAVIRGG